MTRFDQQDNAPLWNLATNCSVIHIVFQIWPSVTICSLESWRNDSVERKLYPRWNYCSNKCHFGEFDESIIRLVLKKWINVEPKIWRSKEKLKLLLNYQSTLRTALEWISRIRNIISNIANEKNVVTTFLECERYVE